MAGFQGDALTPLLFQQSADETTSQWIDVRGRTHLTFYLASTGTTSSGVIAFEETCKMGNPSNQNEPTWYGGTNAQIITAVNASTVSGDNLAALHMPVSAYAWVRCRITTVIGGGGSLSVSLLAV